MIVRDEAAIVGRALASVRGVIDAWVVCDTGSVDDTPAVVLAELAPIPGELHRTTWTSFAHNRTEAVRLARPLADYTLILDADMTLDVQTPFERDLSADAYELRYRGAIDYAQPMLVCNRHRWHYVGATHEYITSPTAGPAQELPQLSLIHHCDGTSRAVKLERDIELLERAIAEDPGDARALFYLAQSYREAGRLEQALACYERRAEDSTGWSEERWCARYQAARMRAALGHDADAVSGAFLAAYAERPTRLEPLHALARDCRRRGRYAAGYLYSSVRERVAYPHDRLFIERDVYDHRLALEHGVCSYALGRPHEAIRAFNDVLDSQAAPDWVLDAAIRGVRMSLDLCDRSDAGGAAASASPGEPASASPSTPTSVLPGAPTSASPVRVRVIVPFRDAGHFLDNCVDSLLAQDHEHFEAIFCDDASRDDASTRLPLEDARFGLIRHERPQPLARTVHELVLERCAPEDVVVLLDGDDWLACPDALSHLAACYARWDCWLLYSQHETSDGAYGISRALPGPTGIEYARERWVTSHLKSYRAGLQWRLAEQDVELNCLKDARGRWLDCAVDAALMLALLDLAGWPRARYTDRVLSVYNVENPRSVHRERRAEQLEAYEHVRRSRRLRRAASYLSGQGSPSA
jgi:glycosyltransferase involved in cell wall biosynthesis